jgi:hypothetical protein
LQFPPHAPLCGANGNAAGRQCKCIVPSDPTGSVVQSATSRCATSSSAKVVHNDQQVSLTAASLEGRCGVDENECDSNPCENGAQCTDSTTVCRGTWARVTIRRF